MNNETVMGELLEHAETAQAEERPVQGPVSTDEKPKKARKTPAKKAAKSPKPAKKRAAAPKAKKPAKAKKAAPKKSPKPRAKATKDAAPKAAKTPKPSKAKTAAADKPKRTYTRTGKFQGVILRIEPEVADALDEACAEAGLTRSAFVRGLMLKKLGIKSSD